MAQRNFWENRYDFFGSGTFTATAADNAPLLIKDSSAAGTPTYAYVDGSSSGELALDFSNTSEIQIVTLYQGNILQYDIDKIREVEFLLKMNQATLDSTTSMVVGVAGDQNDAHDSVAQNCWFRLIGSNALVVETDDGTTDTDDVATGQTLSNSYKTLLINFAAGTNDIRFYVDGTPVATSTTFDMSAYTGSLQLFVQIQKTADTNTDGVTFDSIAIRGIR